MMRNSQRQHCSSAGFTLVELIVVIAIIATITALTIPAIMRPSERFVLKQTVDEIRASLKLTRSAAITTGREQVFMIDLHQRSYGSATIKEQHFPESIEAALKVAEPERSSASRGGIRFFPDGSSTGGELTLSINARQARLCVHWLTGRPVEADGC